MWLRRKTRRAVGPRQNQWKGSRAAQAAHQRQQARRTKRWVRWRRVLLTSGWIVGSAVAVWVITLAAREIAPILQRGLEIREVQVTGIRHVTQQEVLDRLGLKKGLALYQVSGPFLVERLRAHPWIKDATVERLPPHTLAITVLERIPAAVLRTGSGHLLCDSEGVVLSQLGVQDDPSLPLLIGFDAKALGRGEGQVRHAVQSGVNLAKMITTSFAGRVEIDATNPWGLIASTKGVRFQFGSGALSDQWERFRKVRSSLKLAALDGKKRDMSEVDLRYDNRVIVRERG
jgi:cell division protein FtsQ